jgi:TPR repeat protein
MVVTVQDVIQAYNGMLCGNVEQAALLLRMADEDDNHLAQAALAVRYHLGDIIFKVNGTKCSAYKDRASMWLTGQAHIRNMYANYFLAETYFHIDIHYDHAFTFYRAAVNEGCHLALASLGHCYYWGFGTNVDHATAVKYFREAAEKGNCEGQYYMGMCIRLGHGITQDFRLAFLMYKLSAEQGYYSGLLSLADCYHEGLGVVQDVNEATRLRELASRQLRILE